MIETWKSVYLKEVYFALNLAYSKYLKHVALIDIFIIAIGFVLRLLAGDCILDASISHWIVIMTFLLALFLGVAKRRDDVLQLTNNLVTRKNIDGYNLEMINACMVALSSTLIICYILYTVSDGIMLRLNSTYVYLTSVFVILGVLRYMQLTFVFELSGSPTRIVLKDKVLQITILFWLLSFILIFRFNH